MSRRLAFVRALVVCATGLAPMSAFAGVFTVNTTDYMAGAVGTQGGLKAAVAYANANPGTTIQFHIPAAQISAGGYFRIAPPQSQFGIPLVITQSNTVIDATTQTAFTGNTNAAGPEVQLDGQFVAQPQPAGQTNFGSDGFILQNVQNSVVRGFSIVRFSHGLLILGGGYNTVDTNYIGVMPNGTSTAGNYNSGIRIDSGSIDNLIGAYGVGQPNVIGGNYTNGVLLSGGTYFNIIQVNYIGTNASGTVNLGNGKSAVRMDTGAHDNNVGGNTIAFNFGSPVLLFVNAGTGNGVRNNRIYSGQCMPFRIQVAAGEACALLANDAGDADGGQNGQQNIPTIVSAQYTAGTTTIHVTLDSLPNTLFLLDFYASPSRTPVTNLAEQRTVLGWDSVTTDASGHADYTFTTSTNTHLQYVAASASRWFGGGQYETGELTAPYWVP